MSTSNGSMDVLCCLSKLPMESSDDKCYKFIQDCVNKEPTGKIAGSKLERSVLMKSESANLTLAYVRLIFKKKSEGQSNEDRGAVKAMENVTRPDVVRSGKQHKSKDDGYETRSPSDKSNVRKSSEKMSGKQQGETTRRHGSDNVASDESVKLLIEKFRNDSDWDENVFELKQLLSRTTDARQKMSSFVNRKDVSPKLKHLILQLIQEAKLDSSKNSTANKTKKMQENKNVKANKGIVASSSKHRKLKGTPDDGARRKSPRLSSHSPGHFQTKPAMILYMEPASNCKKNTKGRKSTSAVPDKARRNASPILRHSLPKVKRRKLYNPNDDHTQCN